MTLTFLLFSPFSLNFFSFPSHKNNLESWGEACLYRI